MNSQASNGANSQIYIPRGNNQFFNALNLMENSQADPLDISVYQISQPQQQDSSICDVNNYIIGFKKGNNASIQQNLQISSQIEELDQFIGGKFPNGVLTAFRVCPKSSEFHTRLMENILYSSLHQEDSVAFINWSRKFNLDKVFSNFQNEDRQKKLEKLIYGKSVKYQDVNILLGKLQNLILKKKEKFSLVMINIEDILNFSCDNSQHQYNEYSEQVMENLQQFSENLKILEELSKQHGFPIIMFCLKEKIAFQTPKQNRYFDSPNRQNFQNRQDQSQSQDLRFQSTQPDNLSPQQQQNNLEEQRGYQEFFNTFDKTIGADTVMELARSELEESIKISVFKSSYILGEQLIIKE